MSTLLDIVAEHAAREPRRAALHRHVTGGTYVTVDYEELARRAQEFAAAFGTLPGDAPVVPLFLGRTPECVAALLGTNAAGRTFACLHPGLRWPQIVSILGACKARVALVDGPAARSLVESMPADAADVGVEWWYVPVKDEPAFHRKAVERLASTGPVRRWPLAEAEKGVVQAGHGGCVLFTSGSTGRSRGVCIAGEDLLARARAEAEWFGIGAADVLLNVLPFSFDVGLNQLFSGLTAGCEVVLSASWLPADMLRVAAERRVSGISGVPAIWQDMLLAGLSFDTSGAHRTLRYVTISGGDMDAAGLRRMPALTGGAGIFKTYGQTETFRSSSLRPEEFELLPQSVGRSFPGARFVVVRPDGSPCDPEEVGEVIHTGLGTMKGYLDPEGTEEKLRPNPQPGGERSAELAAFTGDLGRVDADGYLFLLGRRDAMLKIAGNRVYPLEVTEALRSLPSVREAEVVGARGADGRTLLVAFVTAADSSDVDPTDLRRQAARSLPPFMVPARIEICAAIPRLASGKPDLQSLVERAATLLP